MNDLRALSLFASGGIGDLALRGAGIETIVANELLPERAELFRANFPAADMIVGDIAAQTEAIVVATRARLAGATLDFIFATPPCQGMSKNGRGKLLQGIRAGHKPALDRRNQLIIPTVEIVKTLRPTVLVIENVPEMAQTLIAAPGGDYVDILDYISAALAPLGYLGASEVVEFADYGVPQRRRRLLTVFSRAGGVKEAIERGQWLKAPTHGRTPGLLEKPWITVEEAISHLPPLDAQCARTATSDLPLHRVPVLDADKYFWVANTPPGGGAFDNQCADPTCGFSGNPLHGAVRDKDGVNQARKSTPIRCVACGALLPRPWVRRGDDHVLMSGFTSAYKRMRGDLPASALTRNLSYACSDQKVHPTQNRALSLLEACIIHTISDYGFEWRRADGVRTSDSLIRDVIGESIPPRGLQAIFGHLVELMRAVDRRAA